jgi:hypothetical protein
MNKLVVEKIDAESATVKINMDCIVFMDVTKIREYIEAYDPEVNLSKIQMQAIVSLHKAVNALNSLLSRTQPKEDKCCETCGYWKAGQGKVIGRCPKVDVFIPTSISDGFNCPSWKAKEPEQHKEKIRVWTCLHCGKDIYYSGGYSHLHNDYLLCEERKWHRRTIAVPKPDSARWVEK